MQNGKSDSADFAKAAVADEIRDMPPAFAVTDSYGYDVQFLMIGEGMDIAQTRQDLESLGWSVIVVGDEETIKVHIHVENPAIPLDYAIKSGRATRRHCGRKHAAAIRIICGESAEDRAS